MTYTTEIIIELSRNEVVKKMDNIDNIKHWQRGLVSAEHISGIPGEVGAKMKLSYKLGKRELELTETISERNFPEEFHATYDAKGVHNIQQNYFEETPEGHTKWISKSEFLPTNFTLRIMTLIMPRVFKNQTKTYMNDFKNFAERGITVTKNA